VARKKKGKSRDTKSSTSVPKLRKGEVRRMMLASNLKRGARCSFDNYKVNKENEYAYEKAVGFLGTGFKEFDPFRGILFYGPTGTGKTHLACAIANNLIALGIFTKFLSTVDIPRNDTEAVRKYIDPDEVPVLLLDDLGAEKLTPRALECLYILIDGRLWADAPMIVTTNYTPEVLRKRLEGEDGSGYGDRLVGRLQEACEFVPVGGEDYRAKL